MFNSGYDFKMTVRLFKRVATVESEGLEFVKASPINKKKRPIMCVKCVNGYCSEYYLFIRKLTVIDSLCVYHNTLLFHPC